MDPYEYHNKKILSPLDKKKIETLPEETLEEGQQSSEPELAEVASQESNKEVSELEFIDPPVEVETLVDHLSELRKQLIKSVSVFILFFIVVFSTINFWFPFVTKGNELIILGPLEVIKFYTTISVTLSLGLSLPLICHFLWQFVKPGLNDKESKFIGLFSPLMLLLFITGIAFGYYVVNPMSYQFLVGLGEKNFSMMVSANEYMHFLIMTTVPIGLLFQLPVVATFLATIGVLTSETMKKVRRWSYVIMAIVSALITPPDFISQLLILIPMVILYEISIYVVRKAEVKRNLVAAQANQ